MNFKIINKSIFFDLILISLIFLIDRISKLYVIFLYKKDFNSEIFSSKFLSIELVWNEGIAFGLLSFGQEKMYNFLTIIIFLIIIFVLYLSFQNFGIKKYSLLLIFAGALGNLYDRIFYNAVPDFIDFHVQNFHWFIFNVADIFITLGVIFMIFLELIDINMNKKS